MTSTVATFLTEIEICEISVRQELALIYAFKNVIANHADLCQASINTANVRIFIEMTRKSIKNGATECAFPEYPCHQPMWDWSWNSHEDSSLLLFLGGEEEEMAFGGGDGGGEEAGG